VKDKLDWTLKQNLKRVGSLVATYESHPDARGRGRKTAAVLDILRAAVVLLHASLEDVLRGIAEWKLPAAGKEALDDIPLAGTGPVAKKIFLGELAAHRGKTVDELIKLSVEQYLLRSNYNNTAEVAGFLASVGVDVTKVNSRFKGLEEMMSRRHQIVHRADRQQHVSGPGDHTVRALNKYTVRNWIGDVESFVADLFAQL